MLVTFFLKEKPILPKTYLQVSILRHPESPGESFLQKRKEKRTLMNVLRETHPNPNSPTIPISVSISNSKKENPKSKKPLLQKGKKK